MALVFRQLFDSTSSTYTYLLGDRDTGEAVLIDTVFEQHARDASLARELGLSIRYVLDTHVHADHVTGAWRMHEAAQARIGAAAHSGVQGMHQPLTEGDTIAFGPHRLAVLETPGHTAGCLTFVLDDGIMAFTGDALMIRGAGRTDFQQGSAPQLFASIRDKIFQLPPDCLLYPAHDYAGRTVTTVREERAHNPRICDSRDEGDFVGYMNNLQLPHPKKLDIALPANLKAGRPDDGQLPPKASWGPAIQTYAGVLQIDPEWVAEHRAAVHLLDVREAREVEVNGAIAGSQHIPLGQLSDRAGEVPTDKPIVTVCRSGGRSTQAVVLLRRVGVTEVANLAGGMLRWGELAPLQGASD